MIAAIICGLLLACCHCASIAPHPFQSKRVGGLTFVRLQAFGYRLSYSYSVKTLRPISRENRRLIDRTLARHVHSGVGEL